MSHPAQVWTVKRLLEWTAQFFSQKKVDSPRLSAELLLSHVLNVPRVKLYTDFERVPGPKELAAFRELVRRAGQHEPIAYLTGKAHFFNLEFVVTPDVLIPRPDTETLVEQALQWARRTSGFESPRVLELCTGSGCVAAAIAYHHKSATVVATEISPAAAQLAMQNIQRLGLSDRVTVLVGDLFEPLEQLVDQSPFDMIVANPPYIATANLTSLQPNVRDYEPLAALDGGLDGLAIHRRILDGAAARLRSGGQIFLEIAYDQGQQARELACKNPSWDQVRILKDHSGNDRVLAAARK